MLPIEQYGGSRFASFSASFTLNWERNARLVVLNATVASQTVTVSTASNADIGFGVFARIIVNAGSIAFSVDDSDGALASPLSLAQDEALFLSKIDNAGSAEFSFTRFAVI